MTVEWVLDLRSSLYSRVKLQKSRIFVFGDSQARDPPQEGWPGYKIAKFLESRSRKIPKILSKNNFREKKLFFLHEKSNANTSFPA